MKVSLWMPSFTSGEPDFRLIGEHARRVEALGFEGIYLLDHLLPISGVHTSAWLDTVVGLAAVAASTERITLGTASLVAGFRHPVLLAKQFASIASVAGNRVVLGASAGWYDREYDAMGYRLNERGARTRETLEAFRLLHTRKEASFEGAFWRFHDVTISPRPLVPIPIYVGGGSRTPAAGSSEDIPEMAPSVLERIARWDGWIAPCAGSEELTYSDLDQVNAARELVDAPFRRLHVQWTYVVDTEDAEEALQLQLPLFRAMMGHHHSDQHFQETYLLGSLADIRARLDRLAAAGFDEVILGPVVHDPLQVETIAALLLHGSGTEGEYR